MSEKAYEQNPIGLRNPKATEPESVPVFRRRESVPIRGRGAVPERAS